MTPNAPTPACIGCDVGKHRIVVHDPRHNRATAVDNAPGALAAFARGLDPGCLVVCEATGGYERGLLEALAAAGVPAHRADARKVHAFIRSFGTLAKTDAIDARALARYGAERHASLARWRPAAAARDALHALVMTRRDLVAQRLAWSNRRDAPTAAAAGLFLAPVVAVLAAQIDAIEHRIAALIAAEPALARAVAVLRGVVGIGPTTAAAMVALMPELGRLGGRQAAALAGLAPHPRQSGASDGYRRVRGGRSEVKRVLFLAAMTAAKRHPHLAAFYRRLIEAGKTKMVALVAVMRKMVVICNAKLRDDAVA